jgi:hypothetical protein
MDVIFLVFWFLVCVISVRTGVSGAVAGWELGSRVVMEANRTVERTYRLGCKSGGFAHYESIAGSRCPLAE